MKNLILPLSLLAAGMLAVSCIFHIGDSSFVGHCTENGIDYAEVRDVAPFRALECSLPCNVYYVPSDRQEVRVESTESQAGNVLTEVGNGTLVLKLKPGRYPELKLRIVISTPDIERICVYGSGNLICEDVISSRKDLTLRISGSGDIRARQTESQALTAHISGSGDMEVEEVSCTGFSGTVSGSGHLDAGVAQVRGDFTARISGSGRVQFEEVSVDGDMDLKTSGSGSIRVNGSCQDVSATISGSGSISGDLRYNRLNTHTSGSGRVRL